jgi:hypothetical protein
MKKTLNYTSIFIVIISLLSACSPRNVALTDNQVSRSDVSGIWRADQVSLENFPAGYSVGQVFGMADYQDFEGSVWDLKGGGSGTITLTNGTVQPVYWSVNKATGIHTFQFKKLEEGQRPKDVTTGYSLDFGDFSRETAVLKTPVVLTSGQTGYINFHFSKQ